ncbi:MAG: PA2779 family protein [Thermodesulfobacteriota bacterium]|nr:PA2779 family protein [Thermodesulfobacteriota bacterium]
MKRSWMKYVASYLVVAMFIIGITPRVYAGFSPSEAISMLSFDRSSDLEKIRKVLEMKMVREKLKDLGFTPNEIEKRLGQLSDHQIHQLALNLDELQVGGSSGWAVLIVILLIAIVVGVVIYVSGHRVVIEKEK